MSAQTALDQFEAQEKPSTEAACTVTGKFSAVRADSAFAHGERCTTCFPEGIDTDYVLKSRRSSPQLHRSVDDGPLPESEATDEESEDDDSPDTDLLAFIAQQDGVDTFALAHAIRSRDGVENKHDVLNEPEVNA